MGKHRHVVTGLDRRRLKMALDAQRKRCSWSWRTLASVLAVSPSTLTRLGASAPDADALIRMLDWLGVDVVFAVRVRI